MAIARISRGRKYGLGRRVALKVMVLGVVGLMSLAGTNPAMAATNQNNGTFWTQFTPSADTRLIFVSSSEGHDSNNGLTPATPVKTLARGYELLRDGNPDWMLLKRGDVWQESFPFWAKSGRSDDAKLVVGAYSDGSQRPQIRSPGDQSAIKNHGNTEVRHVAFVGLHLEPGARADDESPNGVSWLRRSTDILFEDLYVAGFSTNFSIQSLSDAAPIVDIRLNGCVVVDAWSRTSHSSGVFAKNLDGLIVENCVIASNGFNTDRGAVPTIYNHNIYIQNRTRGVVIRNNIIADASSHGLQLRPGGVAEGNLFLSNPLALMFGGGTNPDEGGVTGRVVRNIILHGRNLGTDTPRSFGIEVSNSRDTLVDSNILSVSEIGYNGSPIEVLSKGSYGVTNLTISRNAVVGWHGAVRVDGPANSHLFTSNVFSGNVIHRDLLANNGNSNFNKPLLQIFSNDPAKFTVRDNEYRFYRMNSQPFKVGNAGLDVVAWQNQVEPSGTFESVAVPPPYLTIDSYLVSVGRSGSIEDFLTIARSMSRHNVPSEISPLRVYEWAATRLD
ncbi:right-handed parallel beta-helix repeat-containing protein [Nodularia spumigena]|uniref:right-handed parallel beta-helix repeat-containing protein n=1 Tax=Nodularia spumigena TaxID=70799 RepID=UPI002B2205A3|nr:right-handed parallel beta-helix repeat-containing protein [Nodularia spumigena]MEA5612319.1 right-handed parallel beta-helix repeat-containing protein [Nodularia spumigena UHCC 0040]